MVRDRNTKKELVYAIREMKISEYPLLKDFCYESIFTPEGYPPPDRSAVDHPLLKVYYVGFGSEIHDRALVAEVDGKIVGAVWTRIMDDFGHVDDDTPSFAISLYSEYRGYGIGTKMMQKMLDWLRISGYEKASLSCQKENYAVRMYRNLGFEIIDENDEEYIMIYKLQK
ncbi:MAG: GNAT family N-acetyltransferase [Ruminococcaceae bacterium]|nr:GNAT family N-acetyltransferase [Oscillospiraceae bacterium]